jgi:hypothetical protein
MEEKRTVRNACVCVHRLQESVHLSTYPRAVRYFAMAGTVPSDTVTQNMDFSRSSTSLASSAAEVPNSLLRQSARLFGWRNTSH